MSFRIWNTWSAHEIELGVVKSTFLMHSQSRGSQLNVIETLEFGDISSFGSVSFVTDHFFVLAEVGAG